MGALQGSYGAAAQALTITLSSLANAGARGSAAVDNTVNKHLDALIMPTIATGGSGTSATGYVEIYATGSIDGGTDFGGEGGGTDGSVTMISPPNMRLIGIVNCVANSTTYRGPIMSVAAAFGGILPAYWQIVVVNRTGGTLNSSGNTIEWQGVEGEST